MLIRILAEIVAHRASFFRIVPKSLLCPLTGKATHRPDHTVAAKSRLRTREAAPATMERERWSLQRSEIPVPHATKTTLVLVFSSQAQGFG